MLSIDLHRQWYYTERYGRSHGFFISRLDPYLV